MLLFCFLLLEMLVLRLENLSFPPDRIVLFDFSALSIRGSLSPPTLTIDGRICEIWRSMTSNFFGTWSRKRRRFLTCRTHSSTSGMTAHTTTGDFGWKSTCRVKRLCIRSTASCMRSLTAAASGNTRPKMGSTTVYTVGLAKMASIQRCFIRSTINRLASDLTETSRRRLARTRTAISRTSRLNSSKVSSRSRTRTKRRTLMSKWKKPR